MTIHEAGIAFALIIACGGVLTIAVSAFRGFLNGMAFGFMLVILAGYILLGLSAD